MSKSLWLILFSFLFTIFSFGQTTETVNANVVLEDNRPAVMVHYYVLPHLHFYKPTFKLGLEPKLGEKWGVNFIGGYLNKHALIFGSNNSEFGSNKIDNLNGYYAGFEPKFYPFVRTIGKKSSTYISLLFDIHEDEVTCEERVDRFGGAYQQLISFTRSEKSYTQMINWGTTIAQFESLSFDVSAGIGHRFIKIENDLPPDAESQSTSRIRSEIIAGDLSRLAIKISLLVSFPSIKNGHQAN